MLDSITGIYICPFAHFPSNEIFNYFTYLLYKLNQIPNGSIIFTNMQWFMCFHSVYIFNLLSSLRFSHALSSPARVQSIIVKLLLVTISPFEIKCK